MKRLMITTMFVLFLLSIANAVAFEGSDLRFMNVMLYDGDFSEEAFYANPGDIVMITIAMDNEGEDLEGMRLAAYIPELGVRSNIITIDIEENLEDTAVLYLQLPYVMGDYTVRITAHATEEEDFWKAKHRVISIV